MSDFTHDFWAYYIAIITVVSIIACALLLKSLSTRRIKSGEVDTTGHTWDEDLAEWNNPLPRWWIWLFYITIFFSLGYLVFYPGLGAFSGQGYAEGMTMGSQLWVQAQGVVSVAAYTAVVTFVLLKAVDYLAGLRVSPEAETMGLDTAEHNERGYNL